MRVLVACEYSGVVREAFRAKGHDAWSCDLLPAEDGSPYHVQSDVLTFLRHSGHGFDLMIAHPPCTYLCNSGWHWAIRKARHGDFSRIQKAKEAADLFVHLLWSRVPRVCVENPVPGPLLKHEVGPPIQYIQPYHFGDDASKRTGLWLKNLPELYIPSEDLWYPPRIVTEKSSSGELVQRKRWSNQTDRGQNKLPPSKTRAHERSRTYEGIAKAFAEQWG